MSEYTELLEKIRLPLSNISVAQSYVAILSYEVYSQLSQPLPDGYLNCTEYLSATGQLARAQSLPVRESPLGNLIAQLLNRSTNA